MANLVVFCAQYLFVAVALVGFVTYARCSPDDRRALLRRGLVVLALGTVIDKVGGALYFDPRPFVRRHVTPLVPHVPDNGFPSDHTLLSFGIALLILPFSRTAGLTALVLSALVSWGRVASLLHSPTDIAGGIVFAIFANAAAYLVPRRTAESKP